MRHSDYYILHDLFGYAKIALYDESITARTEKWATPTFLLVIHSAAKFFALEILISACKPFEV